MQSGANFQDFMNKGNAPELIISQRGVEGLYPLTYKTVTFFVIHAYSISECNC